MNKLMQLIILALIPIYTSHASDTVIPDATVDANLFGQFGYYTQSTDQGYAVPGVITAPDAVHHDEGIEFMHVELGMLVVLDQLLAGKIILGSHHGDSVEIEELWFQPHIGDYWTLRIGRQLSPIGLYNAVHEHDWRFVDASLSQQAFLANQYQDDSLQLAYANGLHDVTAWIGKGDEFPAKREKGSAAPDAFGVTYQWQGFYDDHTWRFVSSLAYFDATNRSEDNTHNHTHTSVTDNKLIFDGDTSLITIGAQWQWHDLGIEAEWMGQNINAELIDSQQIKTDLDAFQYGLSTQVAWQTDLFEFAIRYDILLSDNDVSYDNSEFRNVLDAQGLSPQRISAVANWPFSTGQLLRFQVNYEDVMVKEQTAFWLIYQGNLNW